MPPVTALKHTGDSKLENSSRDTLRDSFSASSPGLACTGVGEWDVLKSRVPEVIVETVQIYPE